MNKNILIVLGGAIMAAVLVAVLVQVTLGGKKGSPDAPVSAAEVLVAAKDLKKGSELKPEDMVWSKWAQDALFSGAIIRKNGQEAGKALKGRIDRSFSKGEALVRRALIRSKGNFVAARLKEGERAISVKLKAEDMVAGFITPGSYVDIILTYKHQVLIDRSEDADIRNMVNMNIDKLATETILENIRVLAIDQRAERKDDDKVKVGKTVTLAVSARNAEILALSSQMGSLTLAMRGVGDDLPNKVENAITDARLTKIDNEIRAEYIKIKGESSVSKDIIKIYNGAQVETVPVR